MNVGGAMGSSYIDHMSRAEARASIKPVIVPKLINLHALLIADGRRR